MNAEAGQVTAAHLSRTAYLYVRQSTLRQVLTNTESAARQYALRQRAVALGWPPEQIVVIDSDQGTRPPRPPTGKASSAWWRRSAWAAPASCSALR